MSAYEFQKFRHGFARLLLVLCFCLAAFAFSTYSQRLAIIEPEKSEATAGFASGLSDHLADGFRVFDSSLAASAFASVSVESVFNLSAGNAKQIGRVLGSDYFVLVHSRVQRRAGLGGAEYYEAYAAIYVVSSRSGILVFWTLKNAEAASPEKAESALVNSASAAANKISEAIRAAKVTDVQPPSFEEVPPEDSPAAKNLKPPLPFRRIKPDYTRLAYLYNVRATVDAEADIDADGNVVRVSIVRWAGYGLDESVIEAIRKMNWRPATRNGKTLPMRVLLRYNFTKIEDAEARIAEEARASPKTFR